MRGGSHYPLRLMGPTRVAPLSGTGGIDLAVADIEQGLPDSSLVRVRRGAGELLDLLARTYRIPGLQLSVLDRPRPTLRAHRYGGELHGDYTPPGRIRIWARTAKRGQRVAFLTFLDTLLHEFVHHYDLTYLKLPDTVHSENFYKRVWSLRMLVKANTDAAPTAPFSSALSFDGLERQARAARGEARIVERTSPVLAAVAPGNAPSQAPPRAPRKREATRSTLQLSLPF